MQTKGKGQMKQPMKQPIYEAVCCLCEDLIAYPDIIECKVVKQLFLNKASELEAAFSESHKENLMQKLSFKFPVIDFSIYQYSKGLLSKLISHKQSHSGFL